MAFSEKTWAKLAWNAILKSVHDSFLLLNKMYYYNVILKTHKACLLSWVYKSLKPVQLRFGEDFGFIRFQWIFCIQKNAA